MAKTNVRISRIFEVMERDESESPGIVVLLALGVECGVVNAKHRSAQSRAFITTLACDGHDLQTGIV